MFRRKKANLVSDANLGFTEVLGLLISYDGKVDAAYKLAYGKRGKFVQATGKEIADFIRDNYDPGAKNYCDISHKVYDDNGCRRHHIEVRKGEVLAFFRGEEIRVNPHAKMEIDYVVKKELVEIIP